MDIGPESFRKHFELLSDNALLATRRDDLVDAAKECYDEEVSRRGLNGNSEAVEGEQIAVPQADPGDQEVAIATYTVGDEASLARGLLQSAGIPSRLASEHVALGNFQLQLLVPESFVEHALEVLGAEISEEDLAAQAEAAGSVEIDLEQNGDVE